MAYRVDSFHINVGAGDGAIHILSSEPTNIFSNRIVQRAYLMDGGRATAIGSIERTVWWIEQHFQCQGPNNMLLFDAFVVTHWDGDHYEGIIGYMLQEMNRSHYNNVGSPDRVTILRARYRSAPNLYNHGDPESFLYAPWWPDGDGLSGEMEGWRVDATNRMLQGALPVAGHVASRLLKVRYGQDSLLGRNLFMHDKDNDESFVNRWVHMRSLDGLMRIGNPIRNPNPFLGNYERLPAMYCIAANRRALDNPDLNVATHTVKNMSSLVFIIVWNEIHDSGTPHVSHYFAGDAHDALEVRLSKWMGTSTMSMKLSHHGSSSSNPPSNFVDFNPGNIVVSAGNEYGHPRWEVLFALDAWWALMQLNCPDRNKPFFPCQWPAYLVRDDKDHFQESKFSVAKLDDQTPGSITAWIHEIMGKVQAKRNADHVTDYPESPMDEVWNWRQKFIHDNGCEPPSWRVRNKVCETTERIMERISSLPKDGDKSTVVRNYGFKFLWTEYILNIRLESNPNGIREILAMNVRSAPLTVNGDGYVEMIGRNYVSSGDPGPHWISRHLSVSTLAAFKAADEGAEKYNKIRRFQYLGDDRPRRIDISRGNPEWPSKEVLGHVDAIPESRKNKHKYSGHQRSRSWVDIDVEYTLDSSGEDSWDELDDEAQGKKSSPERPLTILRRNVPSRFMIAAAYIASEEIIKEEKRFPTGAHVVPLLKDHPLFGFVDTLHRQVFSLAIIPIIDQPAPFAADDDWHHWLGRFCTWNYVENKSDVPADFETSMTTSQWELEKQTPLKFGITIPFINGQKLEMDTNKGAEYTFSRTVGKGAAVSLVSLTNMLISRRTIVYGLNKLDQPLVTNLEALAKFVGIDLNKFPILKAIQARDISLTLDTDKDFRNALWFRPGMDYDTDLRLQFQADSKPLNDWLLKLSDIAKIKKLLVVGRKHASFGWGSAADTINLDGRIDFLCQFSVAGKNLVFDAGITLTETNVSLCLTMKRPETKIQMRAMQGVGGALAEIIDWLSTSVKLGPLDLSENLKKATTEDGAISEDSIFPRRVELLLDLDKDGNIKSVSSAFIHIECCLKIGRPAAASMEKMPTVFMFTFGWSKTTGMYLRGKLWAVTPHTPFSEYDNALPEFEEYQILEPITLLDPTNQQRTLNLNRLLSKGDELADIPDGIPTEIYNCEVGISEEQIWFNGAIRCPAPESKLTQPPPISLENLEIDASYTWATKKTTDDGFKLRLAVAIKLYSGGLDEDKDFDEQERNSAKLHGIVLYDKGNWSITASANDLNIAHLVSFWHKGDRGPVMEFLGKIDIESVTVKYEYTKGSSAASKLTFTGRLSLGDVAKLKLEYYNRGSEDWSFTAKLAAENHLDKTATIGKILSSFIDQEVLLSVPSAITDAELKGERGEDPLRVVYTCTGGLRVFALIVTIGKISFWFLQMSQNGGPTKRLIKAIISKISVDIDALNATISSPWEQLFFMWVQDTTPKSKSDISGTPGITDKEYANLKACLLKSAEMQEDDFFLFKSSKPKEETKPELLDDEKPETVIAAGSHLVIVRKTDAKMSVVLDHLFDKNQKPKKQSMALEATGRLRSKKGRALEKTKPKPPDATGAEKGTKAAFKIKLGPLSVENIGLWYKNEMIGITLDASLIMGPVGLGLIGFSIGVPFNGTYGLSKPPPPGLIDWGLQGLTVSLDRPPLTVAGGFVHDTSDPDVDKYAGGLIVGFKPWSFQAMGVYAVVTKKSLGGTSTTAVSLNPLGHVDRRNLFDQETKDDERETFTFAFIFIKMNGPLFSVGFADFAGLVGGFGMNSDIMLPTVEQVVDFPFVKERDSEDTQSPVDAMRDLMKDVWFRPAEGLYWAAAGVRITAFQMLAANIVLVVQFGGNSFLIGIFGVATCDVPALEAPVKFAHVELGIVCTFDANSGLFKLEAQLSPRSFILAPSCHLTGGLAIYAWFKDDPQNAIEAGDWVLTIGGYHQAFRAPPQYPRPPRLGISWSLDTSLSVTGEAYFAVTPKVCMGGGRLHAALSLGALYAWFDAFLDFLINFEPFYFQLQARIAVGVRFTLDLWLVTVRINAEVSASLDLSGPPFGGVVHVDFWVFGFDVKFGAPPPPPPPVKLDRFWKVVLKSAGSGPSSLLTPPGETSANPLDDKKKPDTAGILLTCESGLEPQPGVTEKNKDDSKWYVKGGKFAFLATFQFAITQVSLEEKRVVKRDEKEETESRFAQPSIDSKYTEVFAKPMQLVHALSSEVEIVVLAPRVNMMEDQSFHIMKEWKDQKWRIEPVIKPVPTSVWGKYDRNLDPNVVGSRVQDLLTGDKATMPLITGLSVRTPEPVPADDLVNKFDVIKDRMQNVYSKDEQPLFPDAFENSRRAWQPRGKSKSWQQVQETWRRVGEERPKKAVDLWAKRLAWDKETVAKDEKENRKFNPLTGARPTELLDRFEQMVPALPLIAVGH